MTVKALSRLWAADSHAAGCMARSRTRNRSSQWRRRIGAAMVAAVASVSLSACGGINPATGERQFTLLSEGQETQIGRERHPEVVAEFGGIYDNPGVQDYVTRVGHQVAINSERPDIDYRFTVLDSEINNAMALPGGYVYVTRGLLALTNNEAELAAVLGHEIGHVTARHAAQRHSQAVIAGLGTSAIGIILGSQVAAQVAGLGTEAVLQSYSRQQEFEADDLGVRYLAVTGYTPHAMADFLGQMQRDDELQAALAEGPQQQRVSFMRTHPAVPERINRATQMAQTYAGFNSDAIGRDQHLDIIDGMVVGHGPAQGFVRGNRFIHTDLGFQFEVPTGFEIINGRDRVIGRGPDGATIVFDAGQRPQGMGMIDYLTTSWAPRAQLENVESITVNGMPAATASTTVNTNQGMAIAQLVAVGYDARQVYRFTFVMPRGHAAELSEPFRRTTYSFQHLSEAEARRYNPHRLRVFTAQPGDTVAGRASELPFERLREQRFRLLNGLNRGEELQSGQRYKTIVEADGRPGW